MNDLSQAPVPVTPERQRKPDWIRVKAPTSKEYGATRDLMRGLGLNTVCEEAACPNIGECWSKKHATVMILGDTCTRACAFCNVKTGMPRAVDMAEPDNVAEAAAKLGLEHIVITSVDRDDVSDGGASHFAAVITAIRSSTPGCRIEVLIPDFQGSEASLRTVLDAGPDVLNHNTETVPRLYRLARPGGRYPRALELLDRARTIAPHIPTKTGLILGLGEEWDEIVETLHDLRGVGVQVLTIGQYLRPTETHLRMERYYHPDEFAELKRIALDLGFGHVESGPLVRSSYHAHEQADSLAAARG